MRRIVLGIAIVVLTGTPTFADHFNDQHIGAWGRSETYDQTQDPFSQDLESPTPGFDKWEGLGWKQFDNTQKAWENRNVSNGINNQFGLSNKGYYGDGKGAIDSGIKDPGSDGGGNN